MDDICITFCISINFFLLFVFVCVFCVFIGLEPAIEDKSINQSINTIVIDFLQDSWLVQHLKIFSNIYKVRIQGIKILFAV